MADRPMYDLFVSYAAEDAAWVEGALLDALTAAGVAWHSEAAFALGAPRLHEFERAVTRSRRTVLVLSPAYLADDTASFVDLLAQTYGLETGTWPVVPLLLRTVDLPPRLAMLTALDATDPDRREAALARLCAEAGTNLPAPSPRPPCPYPGMRPFAEAEARFFHGREDEAEDLLQRLRGHPFLAVVGPSGSGKSSLVFAGLVPRLRASGLFGPDGWRILSLRPGAAPLAAATAVVGSDPAEPWPAFAELAAAPPDGRLLLVVDQFEEVFTLAPAAESVRFAEALERLAAAPDRFVVLTVRADFYPELMASPLWPTVQAHRAEVLPLGEAGLRRAVVNPAEAVGVCVEAALVERLAADAAGEPGVLPLVQETLVQLWEKLERRFLGLAAYEALVLPRAAYDGAAAPDSTGRTGLQVAVARHAEAALAELSPGQQAIARRVFLRLIQFGEGRADTRRQRVLPELRSVGDDPMLFDQTLRHLAAKRLITLGAEVARDGSEGTRTPEVRVDLAHEALIGGWPWLQQLAVKRREAEQARERLEGKAAEWTRLGRGKGGLLDEAELAEAERWLAGPDAAELGHGADLPALVTASRTAIDAAHQRELEQARALAEEQRQRAEEQSRAARGLRRRLAVAAALAVLAAGAAAAALYGFGEARTQRDNAESQRNTAVAAGDLAARSGATAEAERNRAEAEALRAAAEAQTAQAERDRAATEVAIRATAETMAQTNRAEADAARATAEHGAQVSLARQLAAQSAERADDELDLSLLLSLEANRVADGSGAAVPEARGSLVTALGSNPRLTGFLRGHTGAVMSVPFSPDGAILASASYDGTLRLWDVATRKARGKPLAGEYGGLYSVAFSPDGAFLASGGRDGTVRLWDVATGRQRGEPLAGHTDWISSVAISPDGNTLASGSADATVRLWDVATGKQRGEPLAGHTGGASVAFSPDGALLASGGLDGTVRLWDVATGKPRGEPLAGYTDSVYSVAFSPDGSTLASGSWDGTIILWDVATGKPRGEPLAGHSGVVLAVTFSPDGTLLASGGYDSTVRLWDVATGKPRGEPLAGHTTTVPGVAFSPDGSTLASGSEDGTVRLWDVETGKPRGEPLSGGAGAVISLTFNSDGSMLATANLGGQVILWDMETSSGSGTITASLSGHAGPVYSVAFSGDGSTLASTGSDGTVRLWDVATKQPLGLPLVGHTDVGFKALFSPVSATLASASLDGTIVIWNLDPIAWQDLACSVAGRNLSAAEWRQYLGDEPYRKTCPDAVPTEAPAGVTDPAAILVATPVASPP